ncbi:hypothetical protein ACZ90_41755 [Streptomyces albus subsp. albus]|nr:hypothetical protein ACZ90_41755 [Streptomyces albus subsp. albus]
MSLAYRTTGTPDTAARPRGRPPYGYRLVVSVVDGRAAQRLAPDERTAPVVRRIFREYLEGKGLQGIAEGLTSDRVPSPGGLVRCGATAPPGWSKNAVRGILVNPRYAQTGHGTDRTGPEVTRPIIPPETFERVREVFADRRVQPARAASGPSGAPAPSAVRHYLLRGLVRCGRCNRLMQGTWNNGQPYYRCRLPSHYATADRAGHPRNVYLREQSAASPLEHWLRTACAPLRLASLLGAIGADDACTEQTLTSLATVRRVLREGDAERRTDALRTLGIRLTYDDAPRKLRVKAVIGPAGLVVRGVLDI